MNLSRYLIPIFYVVAFPCMAQEGMFAEAFSQFSKARIWAYETIPVDWSMDGKLQADFNDGLNNLMEENPSLAEASFSAVIRKDSALWQAYYFRAAALKQVQKFLAAERDLNRTLKLRRDFYEGYVELAKVLHLRGRTEESENAINRAVKISKSQPAAFYVKAAIYLNQGQTRIAQNSYRDCVAADSLFHDARIMLALLDLTNKKDVPKALRHLNKVLEYDSLQKTALLFRALLGYEKNKEQSVRDLTNLVLVSPTNMMAYYMRGVYLTELGNYPQAFSDFHRVIRSTETSDNNFKGQQTWLDKKIDLQNAGAYTITRVFGLPEDDIVKIQEAYCHIITSEFDKGVAAILKMKDVDKEPLALYLLAVALEHKGEHVRALQFYNKALDLDNDIADALKKRAIYAQELKQWRQSISDLTAVLRLNPEVYVTYRIRGVSYFYDNQFANACRDFDEYLKYDSTNKEVIGYRGVARIKNNQVLPGFLDYAVSGNGDNIDFRKAEKLIDSVLTKGDTTIALNYLDKIVGNVPYFTEGYVQKFRIHLARGQWKPIENEILKALRNSRGDAEKSRHSFLLTLLAMTHARNNHNQDAAKTLDEAIKLDNRNDMAYLERGKLLLAMGKASKAQQDLRQASSLGNKQAKDLLAKLPK